jgi:hypothetical protein
MPHQGIYPEWNSSIGSLARAVPLLLRVSIKIFPVFCVGISSVPFHPDIVSNGYGRKLEGAIVGLQI